MSEPDEQTLLLLNFIGENMLKKDDLRENMLKKDSFENIIKTSFWAVKKFKLWSQDSSLKLNYYYNNLHAMITIQAALALCGFDTHCFDYSLNFVRT